MLIIINMMEQQTMTKNIVFFPRFIITFFSTSSQLSFSVHHDDDGWWYITVSINKLTFHCVSPLNFYPLTQLS